jgi:hypothetical protein
MLDFSLAMFSGAPGEVDALPARSDMQLRVAGEQVDQPAEDVPGVSLDNAGECR